MHLGVDHPEEWLFASSWGNAVGSVWGLCIWRSKDEYGLTDWSKFKAVRSLDVQIAWNISFFSTFQCLLFISCSWSTHTAFCRSLCFLESVCLLVHLVGLSSGWLCLSIMTHQPDSSCSGAVILTQLMIEVMNMLCLLKNLIVVPSQTGGCSATVSHKSDWGSMYLLLIGSQSC